VQLRQQKRPSRLFRSRQDAIIEPIEKFAVSCQESPIEQREMKLNIVFLDPLAFLESAASGTNAKPHVPERAGKIRNQRTESLLGLFGAEQKQNVEVRVGEKKPASIPTQRHQAKPGRTLPMRL